MQTFSSLNLEVLCVGSGRAAEAIQKSLHILTVLEKNLRIASMAILPRGEKIPAPRSKDSLLIIANPHGLHASTLLEGHAVGYNFFIVEKPLCVNREEIQKLRSLAAAKIAACHVYRLQWGSQKLRQLVQDGLLGKVFSIEGRYWQSSAAERALSPKKSNSWKNDPKISGPYDVLLDLGTHWADLCSFVAGHQAQNCRVQRRYVNAETKHRDTHLWLDMDFPNELRTRASISKTTHGFNNHLEISVFGDKGSAQWNFLRPDEIVIGKGSQRHVLCRTDSELGAQQAPFHGSGWLEGYVEILKRLLSQGAYPSLNANLEILSLLIDAADREKPGHA